MESFIHRKKHKEKKKKEKNITLLHLVDILKYNLRSSIEGREREKDNNKKIKKKNVQVFYPFPLLNDKGEKRKIFNRAPVCWWNSRKGFGLLTSGSLLMKS